MLSVGSIKVGLPPGFSLKEEDGMFITLRYNGPGFRKLTEPGGGRPSKTAAHAILASVSLGVKQRKARAYFEGEIKRVQAKISVGS